MRAHISKMVKARCAAKGVPMFVIPGGLTPYVQAGDIGIYKSFKDKLSPIIDSWKKSDAVLYTRGGNPKPPSVETVANRVNVAWRDVPADVVERSVAVAGVSPRFGDWHVARHDVYGELFCSKWKERIGENADDVSDSGGALSEDCFDEFTIWETSIIPSLSYPQLPNGSGTMCLYVKAQALAAFQQLCIYLARSRKHGVLQVSDDSHHNHSVRKPRKPALPVILCACSLATGEGSRVGHTMTLIWMNGVKKGMIVQGGVAALRIATTRTKRKIRAASKLRSRRRLGALTALRQRAKPSRRLREGVRVGPHGPGRAGLLGVAVAGLHIRATSTLVQHALMDTIRWATCSVVTIHSRKHYYWHKATDICQ
ncbi:unnamed protein product [Phytophthora fragariaefolia]|uniref:Unnamed protein product n=1 Tax=Phytophthora fragariaefolia TaxID=1490495 RepID=A0A9W6TUA1_9STRA|nr:unnamed protein product [Phytophthora fragariaefolia]